MPKLLSFFLIACLSAAFLAGCEIETENSLQDTKSTSVYATFFPLYAAADLILKDVPDIELNCLVQPQDGCLRNYQLSDWDLALLNTSDVILAGGRGLETFESMLYALGEKGPVVSAVLYNMDLLQQPAVNTQKDSQSHWLDANPHIYMQTDGMFEIVRCFANTMVVLDEAHRDMYLKNLDAAQKRLNQLATEMKGDISAIQRKDVIVMNEALIYSAQELGLQVALCYDRESGEGLIDNDLDYCLSVLKRSDAKVILIEKQAPQSLCKALEDAGYQLARMDVLSTRRADEGSEAYFSALRTNAQAIAEALTGANSASK